jgi:hypothetical protein
MVRAIHARHNEPSRVHNACDQRYRQAGRQAGRKGRQAGRKEGRKEGRKQGQAGRQQGQARTHARTHARTTDTMRSRTLTVTALLSSAGMRKEKVRSSPCESWVVGRDEDVRSIGIQRPLKSIDRSIDRSNVSGCSAPRNPCHACPPIPHPHVYTHGEEGRRETERES